MVFHLNLEDSLSLSAIDLQKNRHPNTKHVLENKDADEEQCKGQQKE